MRTIPRFILAATVLLCAAAHSVSAVDFGSDRVGAIAVFPLIVVQTAAGKDTVLELASTSTSTLTVWCHLQNANSHCSNNPSIVCETAADCGFNACDPGWTTNAFLVDLTPNQPITWRASQGLASVPLSGGSIPPVAEDPFVGALICVAADDAIPFPMANDRNELRGAATLEEDFAGRLDVATYSAIGVEAVAGANDGDLILRLGGPSAEYAACPQRVYLSHFTEGAVEPVALASDVHTRIALLPCAQDLFASLPGSTTAQFLIYNEFEQRFSTSRFVNGLLVSRLSRLDTVNPNNSIFSFNVQGTLGAQTLAQGVPRGVFAVAIEERELLIDPTQRYTAGADAHLQGQSAGEARIGQQPCGDGILDADEDCDDGNMVDGDCCPGDCQLDNCAAPGRSVLVVNDPQSAARTKVTYHWERGTSSLPDFGDPLISTGYRFCVWDDNNLAMQASVAGAGNCGADPCWSTIARPRRPVRGYRYSNRALNPSGTRKVALREGNGDAFARWIGEGADLPLPGPVSGTRYFNQSSYVRVVLFRDDGPNCWQSTYTTSLTNRGDRYRAELP